MFQRHKLEKEEKKAYNEPGVRVLPNYACGMHAYVEVNRFLRR